MSTRPPVLGSWLPIGTFLLLAVPLLAQSQGGPDRETTRRVDAVFAPWDRRDSPGCAVGVYRNGTVVYARGYGMADLERQVPITPRTIFDIGSTSKQFSAAAILLLQQDGHLTLDDSVRKWIPELPAYADGITIRHMLLHTSGLRDYINLLTLAGARIDGVTDAEDALRIVARQKALNFEPGAEHLYSNSGYFLLSVIVERASGQTLQAFARERIFGPLGMSRTHYMGSYDDIVPDRALAYAPREGGGLRLDVSRWLQVGDGAVFTTVEELLHWDNNFYHPRVGGPAFVAALQTPGALASGKALEYALGLAVSVYRGQRAVSHGGSWGGYRAELLRFPDQRFSVAALCNLATTNPTQLARRVADIYLEDVLTPSPVTTTDGEAASTVAADVLKGYGGIYRNPVTRRRLRVDFAEGALMVSGDGRYALRPRSATVFDAAGTDTTWTFVADGNGVHRLQRAASGLEPEIFERVPERDVPVEELPVYGGQFYSDELDTTYTVTSAEGTLVLRRPGAPPQRLIPLIRDEFMAGPFTLTFTRAANRSVDGFVLDVGRVRHLRFERRKPS